MTSSYYSPNGNLEVWDEKPDGYFTTEEWADAHQLTPEELAEARRAEVLDELAAIDLQSARPLRAIVNGTATDEDTAKLAALEAQAENLRAELAR